MTLLSNNLLLKAKVGCYCELENLSFISQKYIVRIFFTITWFGD